MRLWPPTPALWPGSTIVCVGSGPSLTSFDYSLLHNFWLQAEQLRVIAINNAWKVVPWADVLYAADAQWWLDPASSPGANTRPASPELRVCQAPEACGQPSLDLKRIVLAPGGKGRGLSFDRNFVGNGNNSGFQALNLAMHFGAKQIVLLGYDMQLGPHQEIHFHGKHAKKLRNPSATTFQKWIPHFNTAALELMNAGIEVVNCSPRSALTCFPKMTLLEFLQGTL